MKKTEPQDRILIIHGPNMNLIGLKTINEEKTITLNKINKCLQKEAKIIDCQLKIIQTSHSPQSTAENHNTSHRKLKNKNKTSTHFHPAKFARSNT